MTNGPLSTADLSVSGRNNEEAAASVSSSMSNAELKESHRSGAEVNAGAVSGDSLLASESGTIKASDVSNFKTMKDTKAVDLGPETASSSISSSTKTEPTTISQSNEQHKENGSVITKGREMLGSGIDSLTATFKSLGKYATQPGKSDSHDPRNDISEPNSSSVSLAAGIAQRTPPRTGSDAVDAARPAQDHEAIPSLKPSIPTLSPSRSRFSSSQHLRYPAMPPRNGAQTQLTPQNLHNLEMDLTPKAEVPPPYPSGNRPSRQETRSGGPDVENQVVSSSNTSSRKGTIRRARDVTVTPSTTTRNSDTTIHKKETGEQGYFPDMTAARRQEKQIRAEKKANKKADALAHRARSTALASFTISSPTSASSSSDASPGTEEILEDSDGDSDSSEMDDDTPWPSSSRHGDTPLGQETNLGIKSPEQADHRGRMGSLGSIDEDSVSSSSRSASIDRVSWHEGSIHDEVPHEDTGFAVSDPLPPPAGYPLPPHVGYSLPSPSLSSRPTWKRPESYESVRDSPHSGGGPLSPFDDTPCFPPASPNINNPYAAQDIPSSFGTRGIPTGSGSVSEVRLPRLSTSVSSVTSNTIDSPMGSSSCSSSIHSMSGSGFEAFCQPDVEPTLPGTTPFEGRVTVDTEPDCYRISILMEGFSLSDITIAVKSVSRSSSSAGGTRGFSTSDANSVQSASSVQSTGSPLPREGQHTHKQASTSGRKVLHIIADRWEDAVHIERRITFGNDADFSNAVGNAKFDGRTLAITVPRKIKDPKKRTILISNDSSTARKASFPPNAFSPSALESQSL